MEPLPLTHIPTPSGSPKSSRKRTFSPDASTTFKKKPKTDAGQAHSEKRRRRKRRRKQENQPIAHDLGAASGITHIVPSSSLAPASPVPSVSESQLSLDPSQSDAPCDRSSVPPAHSPPVIMASSPHEKRAACAPLGKERPMPTLHSDYKVRFLPVSTSSGVQTHYSLSASTKHFLRALYPLLCARSVLICSTNPLRFLHAGMSHVTSVLSTGSTLISNRNWKVEVSSAKKRVLIAAQ